MKKTKLALGLMTAMLTAGALAGCDNTVKYSSEGKIISYKQGDNDPTVIIADDLLKDYYKDSSKFQSIYDAIYSIVVRNYFESEIEKVQVITKNKDGEQIKTDKFLGKPQMVEIEAEADKRVGSDKKEAQKNADNNGTKYADEFNSILSSKGAKDEKELKEKYIEEVKKEYFDNNFYTYHIDLLRDGDEEVKDKDDKQLWNGYLKDMLPYHVSHILVKLEDGSGTNYANGTISEDNAKKLFNVVDALREGADSFGTIAKRFSDDTGSAEAYGDLGIMDYSTGYVNEFKLGVYAYENFLNATEGVKTAVLDSNIKIPGNAAEPADVSGIANSFIKESKAAFGSDIPTIDVKVFDELNEVSEIDKDINGKSVIDDSANFYPRNIIYNKELNRHSIAYIVDDTADADIESKTSGFRNTDLPDGTTKPVLSVKTASGWTPILCVRAGSDYQGVHFIVVNRSSFQAEDLNGVKLADYYTTYYPDQDAYPIGSDKNPLPTYVNFNTNNDATVTSQRASGLISTFKSYDSEKLNKYIFQKYFEKEGIRFTKNAEENSELADILKMWINRGFEKKQQEKEEAWEKTWRDYVDTLTKQNSERSKLVSSVCKIAYLNGNGYNDKKDTIGFASYIDPEDTSKGTYLDLFIKTMIDNGEVSDEEAQKLVDSGDAADLDAARKMIAEEAIKGIKIGNKLIKDKVTDIAELFKKEGALCNDGKEHI